MFSTKMMYFALFCVAMASADIVPTLPPTGGDSTDVIDALTATCGSCVDGLNNSGGSSTIVSACVALVIKLNADLVIWLLGVLLVIKITIIIKIFIIVLVYIALCISIVIKYLKLEIVIALLLQLLLDAYNDCKSALQVIINANVGLTVQIKQVITLCLNFKTNIKAALSA